VRHDYFVARSENVGPKAAEALRELFDKYQELIYDIEDLRSRVLLLHVSCEPNSLEMPVRDLKDLNEGLRLHQTALAQALSNISITAAPAPTPPPAPPKASSSPAPAAPASSSSHPTSLKDMLKGLNPGEIKKTKLADDSAGGSLQQP
jgi:hypothetical protein